MVVNNKVDSLSYDVEAAAGSNAPRQVLELHEVSLPEPRSMAKALRQRLAEVFFPDDPLHQFKHQSAARRLVLALHYFFPIFQWGSEYSPRLLRSDVVAGLTIASLAIPQVGGFGATCSLSPRSPASASSSTVHRPSQFNCHLLLGILPNHYLLQSLSIVYSTE
jgi:sulfate transporter 3